MVNSFAKRNSMKWHCFCIKWIRDILNQCQYSFLCFKTQTNKAKFYAHLWERVHRGTSLMSLSLFFQLHPARLIDLILVVLEIRIKVALQLVSWDAASRICSISSKHSCTLSVKLLFQQILSVSMRCIYQVELTQPLLRRNRVLSYRPG